MSYLMAVLKPKGDALSLAVATASMVPPSVAVPFWAIDMVPSGVEAVFFTV